MLYGYQHDDGGWGWWFDDQTDPYQSAWVVYGLAVTAEAGYPVDPAVIERGAAYLKTVLREGENLDPRTRAFILYSLAFAGQADRLETLALVQQVHGLDAFSQAGLALALHRLGEAGQALGILEMLDDTAIRVDGRAHWGVSGMDGQYHEKTMASPVRSTALVLSAYLAIRPDHERVPEIVRFLMGERGALGWGTTNETAYTILALTDYLRTTQAGREEAAYRVLLDGQEIASGVLAAGEPDVRFDLPVEQMQDGPNLVQIEAPGAGRLYYDLTSRVLLDLPRVEAAGRLEITRAYLDPTTGRPVQAVRVGDLVRVRLEVENVEASFVMIEDRLPAGLEALNEKLNTTSHDPGAYDYDPEAGIWRLEGDWQSYGYNNKEIRGGRVTFFVTELGGLDGKLRVFEYLARATHAGLYTGLPAEVSAMYDPRLWGRSAGAELTVVD
jgi:uncharacterized protein YfaS (alpha-2-macroglobulin family)